MKNEIPTGSVTAMIVLPTDSPTRVEDVARRPDEEVGVLEVAEQRDVDDDGAGEQRRAGVRSTSLRRIARAKTWLTSVDAASRKTKRQFQ